MALKAIKPQNDFSFCKDYLNACNNYRIINILEECGDPDPQGYCYTDHIYCFSNKMKRKRMKVMITSDSIYIFKGKKKWVLLRKYELRSLKKVVVSSKDFTLAALIFGKGYDLLIDSYRRVDIILYVAERMKQMGCQLFKIIYLRRFKMRKRKKDDPNDLSIPFHEKNQKKMPIMQEVFRNSRRSGYLKLKVRRLFGQNYLEFFFVLSNLGLIYFKSYGVSDSLFFPTNFQKLNFFEIFEIFHFFRFFQIFQNFLIILNFEIC